MKTWKQLAERALAVQSACNLSGIVISFADDIRDVRSLLDQEGKGNTDMVNKHPVAVLYSTQIAFLTGTSHIGCDDIELYGKATEWANQQVKQ